MAIPKIRKQIEARVKDTGDIMTDNLIIKRNTYPEVALDVLSTGTRTSLQAWDNSAVLVNFNVSGNTDNRRALFVKNSSTATNVQNALTFRDWTNGTLTEYKVYGEHNKPLLTDLSGTLGVAQGGTGQTTARNAANSFINALETGSSTPVDADYYISQYVGGGTTTTTYHRRPMSALWSYINGKVGASYLKLTGGTVTGATTFNTDVYISKNVHFRPAETITSGTAAATRNSICIYGTTYGNDATYIKTAGKLSYGDPGPQIIFGTNDTLSSAQKCALIFTDHDTIATGCSLNLVATEASCAFIVPSDTAYTTYKARNIAANTSALTSGSSSLASGNIYVQYE